jgi:hypothetical protein
MTGHSAGAHLVWMTVFRHPERLLGAATTGGNFRNRCIDKVSVAPERMSLPVKGFLGERDDARTPLEAQFKDARDFATAHGYKALSFDIVKGEGHTPMPDLVLGYFYARVKARLAISKASNPEKLDRPVQKLRRLSRLGEPLSSNRCVYYYLRVSYLGGQFHVVETSGKRLPSFKRPNSLFYIDSRVATAPDLRFVRRKRVRSDSRPPHQLNQ